MTTQVVKGLFFDEESNQALDERWTAWLESKQECAENDKSVPTYNICTGSADNFLKIFAWHNLILH